MKLRMISGLSGPDYSLSPGHETEQFDDAEAQRLIEAGFAVEIGDSGPKPPVRPPPKGAAKVVAKPATKPKTRGPVERAVKAPARERRG